LFVECSVGTEEDEKSCIYYGL